MLQIYFTKPTRILQRPPFLNFGIVRWHSRKDGRVVKWQGGRFPVLFKGGGRRVTPSFHLFVSDANQQNEGA